MKELIRKEPVLLISAVKSLLAVAVGFGFQITPEQVVLIVVAMESILAVLARSQVSPKKRT